MIDVEIYPGSGGAMNDSTVANILGSHGKRVWISSDQAPRGEGGLALDVCRS